jgi:hypothetical protein
LIHKERSSKYAPTVAFNERNVPTDIQAKISSLFPTVLEMETMNYKDTASIRYIGIAIGLVATTAIVRTFWNTAAAKARRAGAKLPPGPKQEFLIGNLRNFPKKGWYETFTRWKEEIGIISLFHHLPKFNRTHALIINR